VIRVVAVDELGAAASIDVPIAVTAIGGPPGCDTEAACAGLLGISINLDL
jgi:hypothetical protein